MPDSVCYAAPMVETVSPQDDKRAGEVRARYEPPRLTCFGSLSEMTRSNGPTHGADDDGFAFS
jgi:hypothetical protein